MTPARESDARLLGCMPDPDAAREFYERHVEAVFRFAVRRCRDPEDVSDLVATVFLELFGAAGSFDPHRGSARPWLLGIAARCLADQRRDGYRREQLTQRLAVAPELREDEYEHVERMIDAARLAPAAERALAGDLTTAEREVFLLVSHDGLSVADAARCLGLSAVAGRMRLSRARRKLRQAISLSAIETGAVSEPSAIARGDR
ncbi:MAG: sigma-70 family RNA polymerase sigma factor [Actinomycetota bacterium]|nr:sigma-70 family RNA polymerase sigma factor [Actinomycetota bacterium]